MPQSEPLKPDENSRSRRKDEVNALQNIGEALTKLSKDQLAKIDLPDNLLTAILELKLIKANEAKRRQMQYIGKLMRHVDPEPIKLALKRIQDTLDNTTAKFHSIEEWRSKLLTQGEEALNLFLKDYPATDSKQLRKLISQSQQDKKHNHNSGAERALFRFLRTTMLDSEQET